MKHLLAPAIALLLGTAPAKQLITYTVEVDVAAHAFHVTMQLPATPDTLRLAMAVHPEYDDHFFRYIRDLTVDSIRPMRNDSNHWTAVTRGRPVTVRYSVIPPQWPASRRGAWQGFLQANGALFGGMHTFLYPIGAEKQPALVKLQLPAHWRVATGLQRDQPNQYWARDVTTLMDSPILAGVFDAWTFHVLGVPHHVIYWPAGASFDTARFVRHVQGIVTQAAQLFGSLPYADYTFLVQDSSYGALEHNNSLPIGIPSEQMAGKDYEEYLNELAHEYFHAWNLVRIVPRGRAELRAVAPPRTDALWFSEGFTIYYAEVLARRAGILTEPRNATLASVLEEYFENPGNTHMAPVEVSRLASISPEPPQRYALDPHRQGYVLALLLDAQIRTRTHGRRSLDDAMRLMFQKHAGPAGFTVADVQASIDAVCGCSTRNFFERYIYHAGTPPIAELLRGIGLRATLVQDSARDEHGVARPDLRVWAVNQTAAAPLTLRMRDPESVWGRRGLQMGDTVISVNGTVVKDFRAFGRALGAPRIGDTVTITVLRNGTPTDMRVPVGGYLLTKVKVDALPQ